MLSKAALPLDAVVPLVRQHRLKNVELEVVAVVEFAAFWVVVVPLLVVDRNLHLAWIAVVEAIVAFVVVRSVEVLRIVDVRIVIKSVPILRIVGASPLSTIGLLGLEIGYAEDRDDGCHGEQHKYGLTDHLFPPEIFSKTGSWFFL